MSKEKEQKMKITKLTPKEHIEETASQNKQARCQFAKNPDYRKELVNDKNYEVRCAVANNGDVEQLELLKNDKSIQVRIVVAKRAKKIGANSIVKDLISDPSFKVRKECYSLFDETFIEQLQSESMENQGLLFEKLPLWAWPFVIGKGNPFVDLMAKFIAEGKSAQQSLLLQTMTD